jgi:ornithine cyclodeaminase
VIFLSQAEVEQLLDTRELIDALASAMADLSAGRAAAPPRLSVPVPEQAAVLAAMPGYSPALGVLAVKLVSVFPGNAGTALPTHQALIGVFDPATGEPVAVLDGTAITAARTAACSALSIRLLARPEARVLAVLGTGVQARSHALAAATVLDLTDVRVAGRTPGTAARLADELAALGLPARAVESWHQALTGADVVCATTSADEPVVRRAWLEPGVHVTSVGLTPQGREIDDETMADALVAVEHRATALSPYPIGSSELSQPVARGLVSPDDVVEIGELVAGSRPGRTSPDQITVYKSVGVAVQDAAAAGLVLAAARRRGMGLTLEL